MHVVDGLEEGQHGAVVGNAASTHVVALHAVEERSDSVLQSLEKLLVVLLRLAVLVWLLRKRQQRRHERGTGASTDPGQFNVVSGRPCKIWTYLNYADGLDRDVTFNRLADWWKGLSQWHGSRSWGGGTLPSVFLLLFPVRSIQVACQLQLKIKSGVTINLMGCE